MKVGLRCAVPFTPELIHLNGSPQFLPLCKITASAEGKVRHFFAVFVSSIISHVPAIKPTALNVLKLPQF